MHRLAVHNIARSTYGKPEGTEVPFVSVHFSLDGSGSGLSSLVMPRQPRPIADGLLYHGLNRGNNRATVFEGPADFQAFLRALGQTQLRYHFRLYGYCLMSNHFHLLLAPGPGQSISRILQSLTVAHTWRYHKGHGTSGHVWQGRSKSPVIEDDDHALTVLRYMEGNPLSARMVRDLAAYPWSSYAVHGLGKADPLLTPLPAWERLGRDERSRQAYWRDWVHTPLAERELTAVRKAIVSGQPYGSPSWVEAMATALGLNLARRPRGRPPKEAKK
jgi:putative transposase